MKIVVNGRSYSGLRISYLKFINRLNHSVAEQHAALFPSIVHLAFDHIGIQIGAFGRYEYDLLDLLERYLASTSRDTTKEVAIDIGANIGNHSVCFSKLYSKVYAFEPNPLAYEMLKINGNFFSGQGNIVPVNKALGAAQGVGAFISQRKNIGGSRIAELSADPKLGDRVIETEITSLDEFDLPGNSKVGLLKLDVEGYELEVLKGASGLIKGHKPLILFEHAPVQKDHGVEVISFLQEKGYRFAVPQQRFKSARDFNKALGALLSLIFGYKLSLVETDGGSMCSSPMVFAIPREID